MARDALLQLTGTTDSPVQTVTATGALGAGLATAGVVRVGPNRTTHFQQLIGAVSGTTPTLATKIQKSTDGSTGWTDTGVAFAQATESQQNQDSSEDSKPVVAWRSDGTYEYVRAFATIGGTGSPSFAVEVRIVTDQANVP